MAVRASCTVSPLGQPEKIIFAFVQRRKQTKRSIQSRSITVVRRDQDIAGDTEGALEELARKLVIRILNSCRIESEVSR